MLNGNVNMSQYTPHDNPELDLGKEVETLNKFLWTDGLSQAGFNNQRNYPERPIRGILEKDPWDSNNRGILEKDPWKRLFHIGQEGEKKSQNRIIGAPFVYKVITKGGKKTRKQRKSTRRRCHTRKH